MGKLPAILVTLLFLVCSVMEGQRAAARVTGSSGQQKNLDVDCRLSPPWWSTREALTIETVLMLLTPLLIWRWSVHVLRIQNSRFEKIIKQRTSELEREKEELLKIRASLEEQVSHDPLTGLLNRSAIFYQLALEMEKAEREKRPLAIVLADLDYFKEVNDTYGHLTGDCVLREYAQRLHSSVRPHDFAGRYGGEEFLLILPGVNQIDLGERVATMHHRAFAEPFSCGGTKLQITCSFGVAWYVPGKDTVYSVIERADHALYLAKRNGRNRIEVSSDSNHFKSREEIQPLV